MSGDLRQWAIENVLDHVQNRWVERTIAGLLAEAGGSVRQALELSRRRYFRDGYGDETVGYMLATGYGSYCKEGSVKTERGAPDGKIHAWGPGRGPWDGTPDVVVTWREVFEFVAGQYQLALFEVEP